MNLWLVAAVVLLGAAVALAPVVWSWFDPLSPARAAERFLAVLSSWNGIRDFDAQEVILRSPEGELRVRIAFLAPASFRLEVRSPSSMEGEVFTLRPVGEEWLFVHHRPNLGLGIEDRIRSADLEAALPTLEQVRDGLRSGRIRVTYLPASPEAPARGDEFDLQGLPGPFPRLVLEVDPVSQIPWKVQLYSDPTRPPSLEIEAVVKDEEGQKLFLNTGLELREVLKLDSQPERWLSPPPALPQP